VKNQSIILIAILISCTAGSLSAVTCDVNLRESVVAVYNDLQTLANDESQTLENRVDALQRISSEAPASALLQLLEETNPEIARDLYGSFLLQRYLYDDYISQFAINWTSKTIPPHYFDWLFITENLPEVNSLTENVTVENTDDPLMLLERARLQNSLLKREEAELLLNKTLSLSPDPLVHRKAIIELSKIYSKNRDYQRALDSLCTLVDVAALNADILFEMGLTLISLGRTSEAIDMFEEAIRWDPWHRMANYFLGNGYARENYTQLWDRVDVDCGDYDVQALMHVESMINSGDMQAAKEMLAQYLKQYPECPRAMVMLGSIEWNLGDYWQAALEFRKALDVVPE
jgi:tetratricopeptide (TPR) repeat protein